MSLRLLKKSMRTSAPREVALIRLMAAGDLLLDGARALHWYPLIGESRIEALARVPGWMLLVTGWTMLACAALITVGLWTRLAAVIPIALPALLAALAWERVFSLFASLRLDGIIHHGGMVLALLFLLLRGAGAWSADAVLTSAVVNRRPSRR